MKALMTLSPTTLLPLVNKLGGQNTSLLKKATLAGAVGATLFGVLGRVTDQPQLEQLFFVDLQANVVSKDVESRWAEHNVANREGSIFQFMGTKPAVINITGKWIYENKPSNEIFKLLFPLSFFSNHIGWNWFQATMFDTLQRLALPLFFTYDLFSGPVIITHQKFIENANEGPNVYNYNMTLKEWNPAMSLIGSAGIMLEQSIAGNLNRGF